MKQTSLVYIENGDSVLMLDRNKKEHDINLGKWIGVGGKFELGESPEECMRREVREETGLLVDAYRYCGIVTFVSDEDEVEYMHLFVVTAFHNENGVFPARRGSTAILKECQEGTLKWLLKDALTHIPQWEGDSIFLSLIIDAIFPFFSMKLIYRNGTLIKAVLNEHNCLVSDRLILRPWLSGDEEALYKEASDPYMGLEAGWKPHTNIEESRRVLRDVLSRPEIYAIVLRGGHAPIGSVGLVNFRIALPDKKTVIFFDERKSRDLSRCSMPDQYLEGLPADIHLEAEVGYWLSARFRGQGIMREAVRTILRHAADDLHISRVWGNYFKGNEASKHVLKSAGFHFDHIDDSRYVEALKDYRTEVINAKDLSR